MSCLENPHSPATSSRPQTRCETPPPRVSLFSFPFLLLNFAHSFADLECSTGESGKSTILKQMRLHHVGGYTDEERDGYREIVYANLVSSSSICLFYEAASLHYST